MSLDLRPYQLDLKERVRARLRACNSVVAQMPTGAGKTAWATDILAAVAGRGRRGLFNVHRQELIDQTAETFERAGLGYGIIAAGYRPNPYPLIQIASVDSLRARLLASAVPVPDLVMWDECHHCTAASWRRVKAHFGASKHIGLTATPERLDGYGLDEDFEALECGPSVEELIAQGYLARYRAFAPWAPDLERVHSRMGDYVRIEVAQIMDRPAITGDAIRHYFQHARDKRALAFCVSVEHSERVAQQFRDVGVAAYHLDGKTDRATRRQAVADFRAGVLKVLSNVDLFGEGFDVPAADVSIMLRPTKSLSLFLQQCGRVLRVASGKDYAILLDHAGNIRRHGLPDDPRVWTLEGRRARREAVHDETGRDLVLRQGLCPECGTRHVPQPRCPTCGHAYERLGRVVEERAGELKEIDPALLRRDAAERARSVDDLIAIGRARGYRNPAQWARGYWLSKEGGL